MKSNKLFKRIISQHSAEVDSFFKWYLSDIDIQKCICTNANIAVEVGITHFEYDCKMQSWCMYALCDDNYKVLYMHGRLSHSLAYELDIDDIEQWRIIGTETSNVSRYIRIDLSKLLTERKRRRKHIKYERQFERKALRRKELCLQLIYAKAIKAAYKDVQSTDKCALIATLHQCYTAMFAYLHDRGLTYVMTDLTVNIDDFAIDDKSLDCKIYFDVKTPYTYIVNDAERRCKYAQSYYSDRANSYLMQRSKADRELAMCRRAIWCHLVQAASTFHNLFIDSNIRMELCNAANNDIDSVIKRMLNISM